MSKSETIGWMFSASLHLGVVTAALVGLPDWSKDRLTPPPPIAIEFVKIAEKTQVAAPEQEERPQEQTAPEKPQPNYAREEVVAEAPAEAVPLPDAKPVKKVTEPKPKPKPEISARDKLIARTAPQSKPKPPSRLKSSRIAALIDRSIKEEQEQAPKDEEAKEEKVEEKKEEAKPDLLSGLRGRIATANLVTALSNKMASCWRLPAGAKGVEDMRVTMKIWVTSDGSLLRPPEPVGVGDINSPENAFFRVFVESAQRAVALCAPFPEATEYLRETGQQYILFNFDPSQFLGG